MLFNVNPPALKHTGLLISMNGKESTNYILLLNKSHFTRQGLKIFYHKKSKKFWL